MGGVLDDYLGHLRDRAANTAVTDLGGASLGQDAAKEAIIARFRASHLAGGRVFFVGNGGSAAIASHMANDFTKNGGVRSLAISDAAVLTCLANDYGYEAAFAKGLEFQAGPQDGLVAISSSGASPNILNAVAEARRQGLWVVTLSGFSPENPLRRLGDLNLYIESEVYGVVEVGHLMLLHAVLDLSCGWRPGHFDRPAKKEG